MNNSLMKKWGLLLVTVSLISQIGPAFAEDSLKDIKTHWSKTYVDRLYKEGYVVGSNGYFNPNQALKTEDFLIMVLKTVDPSSKDLKATEGQKYYQPFLERALVVGLIKDPYDEVPQYVERMMPRELAVQVIDRALTMKGENVTADHGLEYKFKDYAIINDVNREAVLRTYQLGIIKGSNGNFEPKNPLTRAEAAVLVSKLMDKSMRDKLIFSKNTKNYDEIAEKYLNGLDATVEKRTIVIEKKADGSINNGDVDFKEIRKWWTDQEFEDKMADNITRANPYEFTNVIVGSNDPVYSGLKSFGGFYVHNGEIGFTNVNGIKSETANRFYDAEIENFNRLVYDLAKYATQFASEKKLFAHVMYHEDYVMVNLQDTSDRATGRFEIKINYNPERYKKTLNLSFAPDVQFYFSSMQWAQDEVYIKQAIYRLYGKDKGEKAYQFLKTNMQNRNSQSYGMFTKVYDGLHYNLYDEKGMTPEMDVTIR